MNYLFQRSRLLLIALASVALTSFLIACGSNSSSSSTAKPINLSEAIVMTDQTKVQLATLKDGSAVVVDTALIPGMPGTYARSGNTVTVTMPNHGMRDELWVDLQFAAGTGGTATSGNQKITVVDDDTFTIVDTASGSITGGTVLRKFINTLAGTYTQSGTQMTVTFANHGLESGDTVDLKFTSGGATNLNAEIDSVIDANSFVVITQQAATAAGNVNISLGTNYFITDVRMHPSGKWVYASSQYDCYNGEPYCWGGDLISRFAIDWTNGKLTFEKSFRTYDSDNAAPVAMVFSADGSLMVSQDDDLDGLLLWSVDSTTGDLTLQASRAGTGQHGIAFAATGNRIYHGSTVFEYSTSPYAMTRTFTGQSGNATTLAGDKLLSVTPSQFRLYTVSNPAQPSLTAFIDHSSTNEARSLVALNNGNLVVTSGLGGFVSYSVGTSTITIAAPSTGTSSLIDGNTTTWPSSGPVRMYRNIDKDSTGQFLISTYATHDIPGAGQGALAPSGVVILRITADGGLSLVTDVGGYEYSRIARFILKP